MKRSPKPILAVALFSIVSILSAHRMVSPITQTTPLDTNLASSEAPVDGTLSRDHDTDFPFQQEMKRRNLTRSLSHQQKFQSQKHRVSPLHVPEHLLFSIGARHALTFIINDAFCFRHIWKNGGTTVELQTDSPQVDQRKEKNRTVVTVVRDPIDHFLAGWQECGYRHSSDMRSNKDYDERIQTWLATTQKRKEYHLWHGQSKNSSSSTFTKPNCRGPCACSVHSLPQTNFLVSEAGIIDPMIGLVGDLRELDGILSVTGFQYDASIGNGKNSSTNSVKTRFFPRKRNLISNETMRALCEFLTLDYFLMDFNLPDACTP